VDVGEKVDGITDEAEELVVTGLSGGSRISPRLGKKALVVVVAS
jgi:hypothetical protein